MSCNDRANETLTERFDRIAAEADQRAADFRRLGMPRVAQAAEATAETARAGVNRLRNT